MAPRGGRASAVAILFMRLCANAAPFSFALLVGCAAAAKPNLLVFQPDDLTFLWDEAPPGAAVPIPMRFATPALDRLREEGTVFTRAYASAPMCAPSRFGLLTARYASRGKFAQRRTIEGGGPKSPEAGPCGVTHVNVPYSKLEAFDLSSTVAFALKDVGYRTGVVGKWHLSSKIDSWGQPYASCTKEAEEAGFTFADGFYVTNMACVSSCKEALGFSHNPEWVTANALSFIGQEESPFFLFMNPTCPHLPLAEEALDDISILATPAGTLSETPLSGMPTRAEMTMRASGYAPGRERAAAIGHFWVDDMFGAVRQRLEDLDVLDETFVAFVMDHGVGSGKGTLLEAGLRIAMVIRYPPLFAAGSTRTDMVSNLDLGPTLCQLGGCSAEASFYTAKMDGKSLLDEPFERVLFGEMLQGRAVVTRNFKYIADDAASSCKDGFAAQLYDLAFDASELVDLSGEAAYAEIEATLAETLRCHLARTANGATEYPDCPDATAAPSRGPARSPVPTSTRVPTTAAPTLRAQTITVAPTPTLAPTAAPTPCALVPHTDAASDAASRAAAGLATALLCAAAVLFR
ncbi:alkaline-phosphatase-like protein [Pelagophyceae sp. CCMP2097]|nr:alkaline-phosphatase-like protein [Pelagophyceae sp. CCMP2097]